MEQWDLPEDQCIVWIVCYPPPYGAFTEFFPHSTTVMIALGPIAPGVRRTAWKAQLRDRPPSLTGWRSDVEC